MKGQQSSRVRSVFMVAAMVVLVAAGRWTPPAEGRGEMPDFRPGELLVQLNDGARSAEAFALMDQVGATFVRSLYQSEVQLWQVPAGRELESARSLNADSRVAFAEPNYRYQALGTPNDPNLSKQWAHVTIHSTAAWDYTTGSNTVTIAIIDTGVDEGHDDLAGKLVAGHDFVDDDSNPHDTNGHGTHVAGIAAAATNNGLGIAGMNWAAKIMPVRVLDYYGFGSNSDITDGITWAATHGADIINLSLGGTTYSQAMQDAVTAAHNSGVLVIAAMGNCRVTNSSCPTANPDMYPAKFDHVMAVAATAQDDAYAYYSQYGDHCDIAAPGGEMGYLHDPGGIYSSLPTYPVYFTSGGYYNNYDYLQGTSQAAPLVAGLAGLVWTLEPALTPDQVQAVIEDSAVDLAPTGWDVNYGHGRIDAFAAMCLVAPPLRVTDFREATVVEMGGTLQVTLRWTAPPCATGLEIRYAAFPIGASNWSSATLLTDSLPASAESYVATIPFDGTTRYFALRAHDADGQWSSVSINAFWPQLHSFLPAVLAE